MAEIAGLVIGGVSLAGMFSACADCFECVQLGRNFGTDSQTCLMKLDLARLKLSRIGFAALDPSVGLRVSESEGQKVKAIFGHILELFALAEGISKRYQDKNQGQYSVAVFDEDDLEASLRQMHHKMRDLALRRQKRSSWGQKTKWEVYEVHRVQSLLDDIVHLVDQLVALFPPTQSRQIELCAEEVKELRNEPQFALLVESAEDVDSEFQKRLEAGAADQQGHRYLKNKTTADARAQFGDHVADEYKGSLHSLGGHHYEENEASDRARVHYGNKYGGKYVLDD